MGLNKLTLSGSSAGPNPNGRDALGFGGTHIFLVFLDDEFIVA
jgi:hypothetical protein